jgi:hypothetical protein
MVETQSVASRQHARTADSRSVVENRQCSLASIQYASISPRSKFSQEGLLKKYRIQFCVDCQDLFCSSENPLCRSNIPRGISIIAARLSPKPQSVLQLKCPSWSLLWITLHDSGFHMEPSRIKIHERITIASAFLLSSDRARQSKRK